jgi:hypothetical protein
MIIIHTISQSLACITHSLYVLITNTLRLLAHSPEKCLWILFVLTEFKSAAVFWMYSRKRKLTRNINITRVLQTLPHGEIELTRCNFDLGFTAHRSQTVQDPLKHPLKNHHSKLQRQNSTVSVSRIRYQISICKMIFHLK